MGAGDSGEFTIPQKPIRHAASKGAVSIAANGPATAGCGAAIAGLDTLSRSRPSAPSPTMYRGVPAAQWPLGHPEQDYGQDHDPRRDGDPGKHVTEQAVAANHEVSVLVRTPAKLPADLRDRVTVHQADIAALPASDSRRSPATRTR